MHSNNPENLEQNNLSRSSEVPKKKPSFISRLFKPFNGKFEDEG
jgi:hypothetical protein